MGTKWLHHQVRRRHNEEDASDFVQDKLPKRFNGQTFAEDMWNTPSIGAEARDYLIRQPLYKTARTLEEAERVLKHRGRARMEAESCRGHRPR